MQEVWSTGVNLHGQLGINRISHLQDNSLVDDISGLVDEYKKPTKITNLACGFDHTVVTFDFGAFFQWGENLDG